MYKLELDNKSLHLIGLALNQLVATVPVVMADIQRQINEQQERREGPEMGQNAPANEASS